MRLKDELYTEQKLCPIDYSADFPQGFTMEKYLLIFKTTWQIVRFEMNKGLKAKMAELGGNVISM